MYAVIFGSNNGRAHQYGQFPTAEKARRWGLMECDGQAVIVVVRTKSA